LNSTAAHRDERVGVVALEPAAEARVPLGEGDVRVAGQHPESEGTSMDGIGGAQGVIVRIGVPVDFRIQGVIGDRGLRDTMIHH
jgi:hypothetical protein